MYLLSFIRACTLPTILPLLAIQNKMDTIYKLQLLKIQCTCYLQDKAISTDLLALSWLLINFLSNFFGKHSQQFIHFNANEMSHAIRNITVIKNSSS